MLIGRQAELRRLATLIRQSSGGMVDVCGPPGAGKSTLVGAALRLVADRYAGARVVDLAGLSGEAALARVRAAIIDLPARRTASRPTAFPWDPELLVLDHADALDGAVEQVVHEAELGGVTVVAITVHGLVSPSVSRVRLRPLELAEAEAVLRHNAELAGILLGNDPETSAQVRAVCEAAHGSPLILELIASRLVVVPLGQLADALGQQGNSLAVLSPRAPHTSGAREAVQASRSHLGTTAQELLDVLGAFTGAFTLEAVEDVSRYPEDLLYKAFRELVDLHLVRVGEAPPDGQGMPRYRLPPVVREFMTERLSSRRLGGGDSADETRDRHALHFASVARMAAECMADADEETARKLLCPDQAEAFTALLWLEQREPLRALRLAVDLGVVGCQPGDDAAVGAIVERLLEITDAAGSLRRDALGWLAWKDAQSLEAAARQDRIRERLDEARRTGPMDQRESLLLLMFECISAGVLHDPVRAAEGAAEGVRLAQALDQARWHARFLIRLGMVHHLSGDHASAAQLGAAGMRIAKQVGDPNAIVLGTLLLVPLPTTGEAAQRNALSLTTAREMSHQMGNRRLESHCLLLLASESAELGDAQAAARWLRERYELVARSAQWHGLAAQVLLTASVAARRGDLDFAARMHGAASPWTDFILRAMPSTLSQRYQSTVDRIRAGLHEAVFDSQVERGRLLALDEAAAEAMDYAREVAEGWPDERPKPEAPREPRLDLTTAPRLSSRELDILSLLVTGRSNPEIAAELFITSKTVMHHTGSIYRKLGVRSRSEAAVAAVRAGLAHPSTQG